MMDNYYKRMVYPFVVNLIESFIEIHGHEKAIDISDFNDSDIAKFAAILLTNDTYDMGDVVWNGDIYSFLISAIRTEEVEDKIIFAEKVIYAVIEHYKDKMQSILEDVRAEIVSEFFESNGKKYTIDQQTGEGSWI